MWKHYRRLAAIATILIGQSGRVAVRLLDAVFHRRLTSDLDSLLAAAATRTAERLGPTYVKLGQLLATRTDLVSPAATRALRRLFDGVRPPASRGTIPAALRDALDGDLSLVAAGSVACVYRGRLRTGETVAVKVRRPGIAATVNADLAILAGLARIGSHLPGFRGAPIQEIVDQLGAAVRQQLDLDREAAAMRRLRASLAPLDGVRVPRVFDEWSGDGVLVLDFVAGLPRWHRTGGPAPATDRARAAAVTALRAVFHMIFIDGFVHCDLHPGNLHLLDSGVVIVDAGFAHQLTPAARRAFAEFFHAMAGGDGVRCADILLGTAVRVDTTADHSAFRDEIAALVARTTRRRAGEFDLVDFAYRLFGAQRTHGFYADAQFIFPILALIVMEGTIRTWAPEVDFQGEALPYVLRALADTAHLPGWRP